MIDCDSNHVQNNYRKTIRKAQIWLKWRNMLK